MRQDQVKERITAAIDRMGRYQILIILLMNLNNLTVGINHTLTSFLTYIPKFFCSDGQVFNNKENMCNVSVIGERLAVPETFSAIKYCT